MASITNRDLADLIRDLKHDTNHQFDHLRRQIMALTANEQAAVNDLSAAVETLATDLSTVLAAAQEAQAKIQAFMDQDVVDAADKAALQAIIDGMETDVVGALSPITTRLVDIDAGMKNPSTPLTPTP